MKRIIPLLAFLLAATPAIADCVLRQSDTVELALGPFVDSTDGFTAETALTISQADVRLKKCAAGTDCTAFAQVNEATSASHEENGWYEKDLNTTDTDTVGILYIAVNESGALPVFMTCLVVEEAVYDQKYAASATGAQPVSSGGITTGSFAAGAIDAAAVAADAIGASELATDAIGATEIAASAIAAAEIADGAIDELTFATTAGAFPSIRVVDQGTAQAATSTTIQLRSAATFADSELVGATVTTTGGSAGVGQSRQITAYVSSTDTATVAAWTTTPTGTITYKVFAEAPGAGGAVSISAGGISAASFAAGAIDASAIAADAIGASELATDAIGAAEVAADAIGASELAANSITSSEVADDSIDAGAIATDAITATEIAANAIAAAEIADAAIDDATFATTAGAFNSLGIVDQGTAQAATSTTLQLRAAAAFADDELIGASCIITGGSAGVGQSRTISDYVSSTDTATVTAWNTTPTGTITYKCFGTAPGSGTSSVSITTGGITAASFASGAIDAAAIAADAIGASEIAADAIGAAEVANSTIDAATFASAAIDATAIATDAIGAAEIAASAIGASELADGGITSTEFGTGAITATVIASDAIGAAELADASIDDATFATTAGAFNALRIVDQGTAQSVTATTIVLRSAAAFADDELIGASVMIVSATTGTGQSRTITDYVSSTDTATVANWTTTPTGTIVYKVHAEPPGSGGSVTIGAGGISASSFAAGAIDAAAIAADAIGSSELATDAIGATELATDAIGAAEIATDAIAAAEIAASAIGSSELADGGITSAEFGTAAITATVIATDAVGAAELASDAVTEIQSGLATAAALATVDDFVDTEIDALPTNAELATALAAADDAVLAAITALNNLSAANIRDLVVEDQGSITLGCALAAILATTGGDVATSGANSTFEDPSGAETRVTSVVVSAGNRTTTITCPTY